MPAVESVLGWKWNWNICGRKRTLVKWWVLEHYRNSIINNCIFEIHSDSIKRKEDTWFHALLSCRYGDYEGQAYTPLPPYPVVSKATPAVVIEWPPLRSDCVLSRDCSLVSDCPYASSHLPYRHSHGPSLSVLLWLSLDRWKPQSSLSYTAGSGNTLQGLTGARISKWLHQTRNQSYVSQFPHRIWTLE